MNESSEHITKSMVFAYFSHQATPIERRQIETWLSSPEGVERYYAYLDEWERHFPQFQSNADTRRNQFEAFMRNADRLDTPEPDFVPDERSASEEVNASWLKKNYRWFVAASVLLLAGVWLTTDMWYYQILVSKNHEIVTARLEDGSEVELRANSSLKYPRFGFGRQREVWLDGEAAFKVAHLADGRRFKVNLGGQTVIEVLGTEFVVNSRKRANKIILKSGSIRLTSPVAEVPLLMKPGEMVTVTAEHEELEKVQLGLKAEEADWKTQHFEFQDTPLKDVALQLHDAYGVSVRMNRPIVSARTLSGTFQAETAEDLLEAIVEMMGLEVEEVPDGYLIK